MKNTRSLMMIAASLLAGLAAVILAARWLSQQTSVSTTRVAVAAVDLAVGQRMGPEHLKVVEWPSGSVPNGTFPSVESLDGRVVKSTVTRDEPILDAKLAPKGTTGGLSAVIGEGRRAITVRVNDVVGVAGFALPGNYVDVIVNTKDERGARDDRERMLSKIVLEKILVLAVAQEAGRDDTKPRVVNAVTLEVTPQEAEKIDLARNVGNLSLVLRNQVDPTPAKTAGMTKETLLDLPRPAAAPAPVVVPRPQVVTVVQAPPAPAPAPAARCVDAFVGKQRVQECF